MSSPERKIKHPQNQNRGKREVKDSEGDRVTNPNPRSKQKGKTRTKSGCLTCRKRRIKCGEERPACDNCSKSKRQCEGYHQRVVFKDPLNTYKPSSSGSSQTQAPVLGNSTSPKNHFAQGTKAEISSITASLIHQSHADLLPYKGISTATPSTGSTPGLQRKVYEFKHVPASSLYHSHHTRQTQSTNAINRNHNSGPSGNRLLPSYEEKDYDGKVWRAVKEEVAPGLSVGLDSGRWLGGASNVFTSTQEPSNESNVRFKGPVDSSQNARADRRWQQLPTDLTKTDDKHMYPEDIIPQSSVEYNDATIATQPQQVAYVNQHQYEVFGSHQDKPQVPKIALEERYGIVGDDDALDVSDDDSSLGRQEGAEEWQSEIQGAHHALGPLASQQPNQNLYSLRTIAAYIEEANMLATYTPSPQTTPLRDSTAARLFSHFVGSTGPTMSLYERHPANPSLVFQGVSIPMSQQHIWTYTFPTLAFQHQGLLHAILALASLHAAKLQNEPITASLRHYAFGLRRVAKSVSMLHRRKHPSTLAAAMLLAFYECWSADHQKWSNHLLGARMLIKEINFRSITKYLRACRLQRETNSNCGQKTNKGHGEPYPPTQYDRVTHEVDEDILALLMGKQAWDDQQSRMADNDLLEQGSSKNYSRRDLEIFETQRDLYWWYCKQDAYQSILGGGHLFMEYEHWSQCHPRAPLGCLSVPYGTFDHLILLMGRLADFAAKDIKRKRLAVKASATWRQSKTSRTDGTPLDEFPNMPDFSGMVPHVRKATPPMGFAPSSSPLEEPLDSVKSRIIDLSSLTAKAEAEWLDIRHAFTVLKEHFSADFQALGPEFCVPIRTPFGDALQYRTYGIAGIWMNYYMALIACYRMHPSMPPAAMIAAGMAARQTAVWANEVGKIAAGIAPELETVGTESISPGVGAALIESSTCLFIAGVQFQDQQQRSWIVSRLHSIARVTGWETALAICTGCETSWVKAAEAGKGPPYIRITEERVVPDTWRRSRTSNETATGLDERGRRLNVRRSDRVHYALGILGLEEDFENLDLDNEN